VKDDGYEISPQTSVIVVTESFADKYLKERPVA